MADFSESGISLAWIGNLGNVGFNYVRLLNAHKERARLYIPDDYLNRLWPGNPEYEYKGASKEEFVFQFKRHAALNFFLKKIHLQIPVARQFSEISRTCNIVQAQTGHETDAYEIYRRFKIPFAALTTGADLSELAFSSSWEGRSYKSALSRAGHIFLVNIDQFDYLKQLQLDHVPHSFLPFNINANSLAKTPNIIKEKIVFFSIARLDWKSQSRKSVKRNDIFFRGFAEFVRSRGIQNYQLQIADWGVDRKDTHALIKRLGIEKITEFVPVAEKTYFYDRIRASNVVVDQFNLGAIGLGALEAMALSRPVIAYCAEDTAWQAYGEPIPVMNASDEGGVQRELNSISQDYLDVKSQQSYDWVQKHHSEQSIVSKLTTVYKNILNVPVH
jgi:glycosyltransferase involved in cell wall biosynthesis